MNRRVMIVGASVLLAAACGKSKEQQQAEQLQKSAEQMQKGAEDFAKGLESMAKGVSGAAGDPNAKPVDPVSFKSLQAVLPEIPGWERDMPTGERMTAPFAYSEASVTLRKGDADITEKITDSAFNQMLTASFSLILAGNYSRETDHGYERAVTIGGAPAQESWDKQDKSGDLKVVVNKRFIVDIEAHGIDDPNVLRTALDRTDLKKLAALK